MNAVDAIVRAAALLREAGVEAGELHMTDDTYRKLRDSLPEDRHGARYTTIAGLKIKIVDGIQRRLPVNA